MAGKRLEMESRRDRLVQAATKLSSIVVPSTHSNAVGGGASGAGGHHSSSLSTDRDSLSSAHGGGSNSSNGEKTLSVMVAVSGSQGIGLVLTTDSVDSSKLAIKGFQPLPDGAMNPSQLAGLHIGDKLLAINDEGYSEPGEAVGRLKKLKGPSIKITVARR